MKRRAKQRTDAVDLTPVELVALRRVLREDAALPAHRPAPWVARRLGVTARTVCEWVKRGEVPGRLGKPVLVSLPGLAAFLGSEVRE